MLVVIRPENQVYLSKPGPYADYIMTLTKNRFALIRGACKAEEAAAANSHCEPGRWTCGGVRFYVYNAQTRTLRQ